jgi:hypothetical protein
MLVVVRREECGYRNAFQNAFDSTCPG